MCMKHLGACEMHIMVQEVWGGGVGFSILASFNVIPVLLNHGALSSQEGLLTFAQKRHITSAHVRMKDA